MFKAILCWCNFLQRIKSMSCIHFVYSFKNLILGPFTGFLTETFQSSNDMFYPTFSLYASMHQFVVKKSFWAFFYPKTLVQDFSWKINWFNFKSLCCFDFMQKIRRFSCIDLSQKLANLILSPFWAPFGPKTSKESVSQKINLFNCKFLCCFNFIQKSTKFHVLILIIPQKPYFGPILDPFWHKTFITKLFPKNHLDPF